MSRQKCFSIPEVKIFLVFSFLLVELALFWISITFQVSSFEATLFHINNYIKCNLGGIRAGLDCGADRRRFEELSYPYLSAANTAAYAILSLSNLPLVLQYNDVRQSFRKLARFFFAANQPQQTIHKPTSIRIHDACKLNSM